MSCDQKKTGTRKGILFVLALLATWSLLAINVASAQIFDTPGERLSKQIKAKKKPYQISSRIHLSEGTRQGYLVVEVKLEPGHHIYSLTQSGDVPPTKLTVASSDQFRLTGKFAADKPAIVLAVDPSMGQRTEKHTGSVQFFAPVEIAAGIELQAIVADVQFTGQVCNENSCIPVRSLKAQGKFAGYFNGAQPTGAKGQPQNPSVATRPNNVGDKPVIQ